MKFPGYYYALGGAALALFVSITAAVKQHDRRIADYAAAHQRIIRDSATIASLQKRLHGSDSALVHNIGATGVATVVYREARATLPGKRIIIHDTTPGSARIDTVYQVPAGYIRAADAAVQQCDLLKVNCAEFRLMADSTMAAQARIIAEQAAHPARKPSSPFSMVLHLAIGAAAGRASCGL